MTFMCKDIGAEVAWDGCCVVCRADAGEACRLSAHEREVRAAWEEAQCCDDIPLQGSLADVIAALQADREQLRADLEARWHRPAPRKRPGLPNRRVHREGRFHPEVLKEFMQVTATTDASSQFPAVSDLAETQAFLQSLAGGLDEVLGNTPAAKRTGFVLLVFPFGGPSGARTNYVSNGEREDVLAALKEIVARFEGHHHEGGRA